MSNYPLHLPETLMEDAREMANAQGVSINQFLSTPIAERIGELKRYAMCVNASVGRTRMRPQPCSHWFRIECR